MSTQKPVYVSNVLQVLQHVMMQLLYQVVNKDIGLLVMQVHLLHVLNVVQGLMCVYLQLKQNLV